MSKLPRITSESPNDTPSSSNDRRRQLDSLFKDNDAIKWLQQNMPEIIGGDGYLTPSEILQECIARGPSKGMPLYVQLAVMAVFCTFTITQGCASDISDYDGLQNVQNDDEINILDEYPSDKKVAVIINGSDEKRHNNDVKRAISDLRKKGFKRFYVANKKEIKSDGVKLFQFDGTNEGIDELLSQLSVGDDDYLFFYATGHGEAEGDGMCVDTGKSCYSQNRLIEKIKHLKGRNGDNLFVHSNCYSGALAEDIIGSGLEGKAISSATRGQISYSGFSSTFFDSMSRNADMNLDGVSEPSDWFRASMASYRDGLERRISNNHIAPMPGGITGTFVESEIDLGADNIDKYLSSKKVLIVYVPTNDKEVKLPEAIQKIKNLIGDTVNIAVIRNDNPDKQEILKKCETKDYRDLPSTILKNSHGEIATISGVPDLDMVLNGADIFDWYRHNLRIQKEAEESRPDVSKEDIVERLYKFGSEKVLADAKSFADKPWAYGIVDMISAKDPKTVLKYAYLFEEHPWAEKIVKRSLKRHKNGHQYIFDLQTEWGKSIVDEYVEKNYVPSVQVINRNSETSWGKDLEEKYIKAKKWDKDTALALAKINSDVVLRYFDKYGNQPWAREIVDAVIANREGGSIGAYYIIGNADKFADAPWCREVVESALEINYNALFEHFDKIANQPWAKNLLLKYVENHPKKILENADKFADQPWAKELIITAMNAKGVYGFQPYEHIDKFANQPWAKEVAEAMDGYDVINNIYKFADQPWAQSVIENKVHEMLGQNLYLSRFPKQIPVLSRYPWGKKLIKDVLKEQPNLLTFCIDDFAKLPDAEKLYLKYAKEHPRLVLEETEVFLKYPWGMKVLKNASKESPEHFFANFDKLKDQPWAASQIKLIASKNLKVVLKNADKFADQPWAEGIIMPAADKLPKYVLKYGDKFADQPWAKKAFKISVKSYSDLLKMNMENGIEVTDSVMNYLELFISEPYAKDIVLDAIAHETQRHSGYYRDNLIIDNFDKIVDQPWAKEAIMKCAFVFTRNTLENADKFIDKPWAKEVFELMAKKRAQSLLSNYEVFEDMEWAKEVVQIAATHSKKPMDNIQLFVNEAYAKDIVIKQAKIDAYEVVGKLSYFVNQPWAEEVMNILIKKEPQRVLDKAMYFIDKPWAKKVIAQAFQICDHCDSEPSNYYDYRVRQKVQDASRVVAAIKRRVRKASGQEEDEEDMYAANSLRPTTFKPTIEKSFAPVVDVPEIFEYFDSLRGVKGNGTAVFSNQIFSNYRGALENGHSYSSDVLVENYDGTSWSVKNSCVGFVLSAFANLPLTVASGESAGDYISNYKWGTLLGGRKDAFEDFIPDIAGGNSTKYHSYEEMDPGNINQEVAGALAVGEYAVAAFWNHVFLIYKDTDGTVQMVHSGADVDGTGLAKVNQTTLTRYAERNERKHSNTRFIFMPLSNIIEESMGDNGSEIGDYVSRILDKIDSRQLSARLTAVNTDAIQIGKNKLGEQIEELGIDFTSIDKSTDLFADGIGNFDQFKQTIASRLQPNEKNSKTALNNALDVLNRSAVGMYQIVPQFYFNMMGWSLKGEEGLKNVYNFIKSKELQDKLADKIINHFGPKYEWDGYAIATAFYKGPAAGRRMYKYRQDLKEDPNTKMPKSFKSKSRGGYGSIITYSKQLIGFYGKDVIETEEDKVEFRKALGQKESGYIKNS